MPEEPYKQDEYYVSDEIRVIDGVDTVFVTYACTISGMYTTNYTDKEDFTIEFNSCFSEYGEHRFEVEHDSITDEDIYIFSVDSASGDSFVLQAIIKAKRVEEGLISYKIELENSDFYSYEILEDMDNYLEILDGLNYSLTKNDDLIVVEYLNYHYKEFSKCDVYQEISYTYNNQSPLIDINLDPWNSTCLIGATHEESIFFSENRNTLNYELKLESVVPNFDSSFVIQDLKSNFSVKITDAENLIYGFPYGGIHRQVVGSLDAGTYNIEITLEEETAYPEIYFQIYAPGSTLTFIE